MDQHEKLNFRRTYFHPTIIQDQNTLICMTPFTTLQTPITNNVKYLVKYAVDYETYVLSYWIESMHNMEIHGQIIFTRPKHIVHVSLQLQRIRSTPSDQRQDTLLTYTISDRQLFDNEVKTFKIDLSSVGLKSVSDALSTISGFNESFKLCLVVRDQKGKKVQRSVGLECLYMSL